MRFNVDKEKSKNDNSFKKRITIFLLVSISACMLLPTVLFNIYFFSARYNLNNEHQDESFKIAKNIIYLNKNFNFLTGHQLIQTYKLIIEIKSSPTLWLNRITEPNSIYYKINNYLTNELTENRINKITKYESVINKFYFYVDLAHYYSSINHYKKAIKYYRQALTIYELNKPEFNKSINESSICNLYSDIGILNLRFGRYQEAKYYLLSFLNLTKQKPKDIYEIYHYLGFIYLQEKNYTKAKDYLKKAKETASLHWSNTSKNDIFYDKNQAKDILNYYNRQIALLYIQKNEIEKAKAILKALSSNNSSCSYKGYTPFSITSSDCAYEEKGLLYEHINKYGEAKKYYKKALNSLKKDTSMKPFYSEEESNRLVNLARVEYYQYQYQISLKYAKEAYLLNKKLLGLEHPETICSAYQLNKTLKHIDKKENINLKEINKIVSFSRNIENLCLPINRRFY
ncbi:MAG: tetratricopeptide repeat protein [bacterium]